MKTLILVYADLTEFVVRAFETEAEALAWLAEEKTRPYWLESTTYKIV